MNRRLAVLAVGVLTIGIARADIAPPKGLKRIALEHKITTDKELGDYVLYAISGGDKATALKLDPKTPATITAGGGRYRTALLVAVPKGADKKFDNEKDFLAAVAKEKVDGLIKAKTTFSAITTVKDTDPRTKIVKEYTLDRIDPKNGIVLTEKKEDSKPKPDEESPALTVSARGGNWIAGVGLSLGLLLGGMWLATRNRMNRH